MNDPDLFINYFLHLVEERRQQLYLFWREMESLSVDSIDPHTAVYTTTPRTISSSMSSKPPEIMKLLSEKHSGDSEAEVQLEKQRKLILCRILQNLDVTYARFDPEEKGAPLVRATAAMKHLLEQFTESREIPQQGAEVRVVSSFFPLKWLVFIVLFFLLVSLGAGFQENRG